MPMPSNLGGRHERCAALAADLSEIHRARPVRPAPHAGRAAAGAARPRRPHDPVVTDTATIVPALGFDEVAENSTSCCCPAAPRARWRRWRMRRRARDFVARHAARAPRPRSAPALADPGRRRRAARAAGDSHWLTLDLLRLFGADPVAERVEDGQRDHRRGRQRRARPGAGRLVQRLRGTAHASLVQLVAEYDPRPPLAAGSPASAPVAVVAQARSHFAAFNARLEAAARRSRQQAEHGSRADESEPARDSAGRGRHARRDGPGGCDGLEFARVPPGRGSSPASAPAR